MKKFALFSFTLLLVLGVLFVWSGSPISSSREKIFVTIEPGSSVSSIATLLEDKELIRSPMLFRITSELLGVSSSLKTGTFALTPSMSLRDIIGILHEGKIEEVYVTVPEGFTVRDIDALLASKGLGEKGDIIRCAFECDFSSFVFLPTKNISTLESEIGSRLEGYLFPETYAISAFGYQPKFFLERMLGEFQRRITEGMKTDIDASGKTIHEMITMASLIEEESRHEDERAVISGILWKRLREKVVLAVDATTRYELNKKKEPLLKSELDTQSLYNTRRKLGLPPGPIASPGESSIMASLKPKETEYWYYLHGKDGTIHYALSNEEHNKNKTRYLR